MRSLAETTLPTTGPRGRELLRALAEGTAGEIGDEFLRSLVRHLAQALGARLAFVAEATRPDGRHVTAVACWYRGRFLDEPFEYDTDGLPCALVPDRPVVAVPEALTTRFPEDQIAVEMGLESYLAVCLRAADGTHLGHICVCDSGPMEAGDDEIAALRVFASRAAAELERRRQAAALQASRARVIEAGDAERRRVGRDLHDGAQQRLGAVANLLKVARRSVDDAGRVDALLEMAAGELSQAHRELRDLARGLHPVALAERGLRGALESLAATCALRVELDVADAQLPENVALAAYFVVAESLANAQKYAQADVVRVRAAVTGGELVVEVADDGVGGADLASGTGLCGLADRMESLGGRLEITSPIGGGTRVRAVAPLARAG